MGGDGCRLIWVEYAHLNARRPQPRNAPTSHQRIGVLPGHDYLGNARFYQGIAARRCAPKVGAGFERDVSGGAANVMARFACGVQGHDFGVRATRVLGVALTEHIALHRDKDAAHPWVGWTQVQG